MNLKQREIALLPYPFSDLEGKKVRPALVVSNDAFNDKSDDVIMVPLTSILKQEPYSIIINQKDLNSGKLIKISRIRADKIFSVEKRIAIMKIGVLNNAVFEKVKSELLKIF